MVDVAADYSVGLANFFVATFEELGGEIVSQMRYQTGDQEFTAQLTEIIARGAEVLFIPGYFGDAALIARQLRDLGSNIQILGGDALDAPELMTIGGDAVEGLCISSFFSVEAPQTEQAKIFTEAFQAKYGQLPNAMAALGYDSYMIIRDAIERAGSDDPKAIRDALAATEDFPAVTGNTTLNEHGDAVKDAVILQVQNGEFRYLTTVPAK
jgi:branched-chain amino acid transport system substrate-binding protein